MERKIEAYIFDMDGVLVSTEKYHFASWKRLAETLGFSIDEEFNEQLKGVSRAVCIDLIVAHGNLQKSQEEKDMLAAQKNEWFLEYISEISQKDVLQGVLSFLQSAKQKNIKMAVGSASKNAPLLLQKMGITHFFDAIVDGNSITNAKPNPEVFLKAAQNMNVSPQKCLVFEDAQSGVTAAKRAGMFCVGIGNSEILSEADVCFPGFATISIEKLEDIFSNNTCG